MLVKTMAVRVRNPETRLISEFMLREFPAGGYRLRVPLGPPISTVARELPPDVAARISRPWRPEVDAIGFKGNRLILVEGKILRLVDGIAKLPMYKALVPSTPELEPFRRRRIEMWLVAPWTGPAIDTIARAAKVQVKIYKPDWIQEYVKQLHDYWTKEHREKREELKRLREALGVE